MEKNGKKANFFSIFIRYKLLRVCPVWGESLYKWVKGGS